MNQTTNKADLDGELAQHNPFKLRSKREVAEELKSLVHVYGKHANIVCKTEERAPTPPRMNELVVGVNNFIPLWDKGVTLRWRFQEQSMSVYANPTAAKNAIRQLFNEAIAAWGDSAPVKFSEQRNLCDFEIVVQSSNECSYSGCVLASSFFPDTGKHELTIFPEMFAQVRKEQVETLVHEIGHVFGLRHFFAQVNEQDWPSQVFGRHNPLTIMNYGAQSQLTSADKEDLKRLYQQAWSGQLRQINGTPIKLMKPLRMP
ncbi:MAG: matrixin family metalloprotease [Magnetococcales bacterium]|nr:matrixin family metalloprotease [Magnetococcales bacterium]